MYPILPLLKWSSAMGIFRFMVIYTSISSICPCTHSSSLKLFFLLFACTLLSYFLWIIPFHSMHSWLFCSFPILSIFVLEVSLTGPAASQGSSELLPILTRKILDCMKRESWVSLLLITINFIIKFDKLNSSSILKRDSYFNITIFQ